MPKRSGRPRSKGAPLGLAYSKLSHELIREIKYAIREVEAQWYELKISGYKPQHLSCAVVKATQEWYFKQHQELVEFAERVKANIKQQDEKKSRKGRAQKPGGG